MKKVALVVLSILCLSQMVSAVSYEASMSPIMSKAKDMMNYIEDDLDMEIVRMEFDILSSSKTTIRTLNSDYTYAIVAFGDYRFKDIDVKVYRRSGGEWTLVEQDVDTEAIAVVTVKPSYSGEYKIVISAYSFQSGYSIGHYGLIVAHE